MPSTEELEPKENTESFITRNKECSTPWDVDLEELEAETNAILERFGKSKSGSRKQLSSPTPHRKRVDSARPLTQASTLNRSFRLTSAAYDGSKKRLSRQSKSATSTASLDNDKTPINEDLRLFQADGSARKTLRNTISSALTGSKFDSVPSLLAGDLSSGWNEHVNVVRPTSSFREKSQSMVSVMKSTRKLTKHTLSKAADDLSEPKSLSLQDVSFGYESTEVDTEKEVCYNCWSSGDGKKCQIHVKNKSDTISSQNLSMCSNWNAGYLRRKYRAEEIQEVFNQQSQSLVFDKSQKQFLTQEEAKHPVYRLINQHVSCLNSIYQRRQNTKTWLTSFIHRLKEGSFQNNRSAQSAKILCLRGTTNNMAQVQKIKREMFDLLPKAPVTGTTMREKLGQDHILVERTVNIDGEETTSNFILAGPTPVPKALYMPRKYEATPPTKFILQVNKQDHKRNVSNDDADLSDLDFASLHRDHNNFVQYVTFGRKGSNGNLAVGGLSAQLLVSGRFTSCFPPQYKNITCSDEAIMLPPKQIDPPNVPTLEVPPDNLPYIRRELITPLDTRLPPTIMTKVNIHPENDRHYFGLNRVEQTGETGDYGFRTSISYELPEPNGRIDPRTFTPSENIATPNALAVTSFRTEKVDENYPFCPEKSRTNRVEDLYHLLLSNGECSTSKLQVFTTVGSQQVGYFMQNGDATLPIGRMVTKVVRTLTFLQGEPERGEDPYEDPPADRIYQEEKASLNLGGVLFNDRPRYQDMPEGVLYTNSKSEARNAILRKSIAGESKLDDAMIEEEQAPPILKGLLNSIAATRVGKRQVEYLSETCQLNLPNAHCIETHKPKNSIEIWNDQCYNPWIEGKDLLSTHFVRSLSQETKRWPKVNHNKEDYVESDTVKEFAALCSLVRHGKYRDLEDTLNGPEWSLPIDYCDESGNTLLMVACQNGNRRIVKLCLRRGSKINKQNLNGNTSLHFAFGYGFGKQFT